MSIRFDLSIKFTVPDLFDIFNLNQLSIILSKKYTILFVFSKIYILSVVALDETNISSCLHLSMQNVEMSCDLDHAP